MSQSFPTPITQELFRVVVREALGAPGFAFPVPVAPIAPEPPVPDVSTPVKVMTVMEAETLCDNVAVTATLVRVAGAKARQISAVPLCALVRLTRVQVRPAPVTLVTVMVDALPSVATNASSSSFALVVEKAGEARVVDFVLRFVETVLSIAGPVALLDDEVKFTMDTFRLFKVTFWLVGLKVKPDLLGVTV